MSDWRPVVAALADADRRSLLARVTVAADAAAPMRVDALSSAERRRAEGLARAGVVTIDGDGIVLPADPFTPLLGHRAAASGIDRFVREGRIVAWPKRPGDRAALLAWAASHAVQHDETASEATVTSRLAEISDDPATLRRDLVDGGLLERSADGSAYRVGRG